MRTRSSVSLPDYATASPSSPTIRKAPADSSSTTGWAPGPTAVRHGRKTADDPEEEATNTRFLNNLDMFFAHVIEPLNRYRPDISALRRASTRLVVAAGTESVGQLPYRAANALADALMVPLTELPRDHFGFANQPEPFARALEPTPVTDREEDVQLLLHAT